METDCWFRGGGWRVGLMGKGGQKVENSSYKISLDVNVQHDDYSQYCIIYLKIANRVAS